MNKENESSAGVAGGDPTRWGRRRRARAMASALSPTGITGDKVTVRSNSRLIVHLDWLNITAPVENLKAIEQLVESFLGPSEKRRGGKGFYECATGWETGGLLAWSDGRPECWLSLNGDSCDLIPPSMQREFCLSLKALGARGTRLDAALDIPRDLISMEDVHRAARCDQVDGFRRYKPDREFNMGTGRVLSDTARFGTRGKDGSGRYVRVYDKGLESKGELDVVRLEAELTDDVGAQVFAFLCCSDSQDEFNRMLGEFAAGSIDFVDKSGAHRHRERFRRLQWFQRIRELAGHARCVAMRVRPALEQTCNYLLHAYALVLARVRRVAAAQGLCDHQAVYLIVDRMLIDGEKRLSWLESCGKRFARDLACDVRGLARIRPALSCFIDDDGIPPFE